MLYPTSVFEFDPAKSAANKAKHGIDFEEAQALWLDQKRREVPARRHGSEEERWVVIGEMSRRIWTAVVTYREEAIRIISVRRARQNEEEAYGNPQDD